MRQQDVIRRLERRVQFIAKEREGCVKVLNSYKVDGNVDTVVREMNKEVDQFQSFSLLNVYFIVTRKFITSISQNNRTGEHNRRCTNLD